MERFIPLGIGLTFTIWGALWGLIRWRLRRGGVRTKGTVVDHARSGLVRPTIYPIVEFIPGSGPPIRIRGSTGQGGSSPYQLGEQVDVIYSRDNPGDAQIGNFEQFWLGPVALGLFGLIILVVLASGARPRSAAPASPVAVGLIILVGAVLLVLAVLKVRACRTGATATAGASGRPDLLARVDQACRLHPEAREQLLRLKTMVETLKNRDVDVALEGFLDKILAARDRAEALSWIQELAKRLDLFGKG